MRKRKLLSSCGMEFCLFNFLTLPSPNSTLQSFHSPYYSLWEERNSSKVESKRAIIWQNYFTSSRFSASLASGYRIQNRGQITKGISCRQYKIRNLPSAHDIASLLTPSTTSNGSSRLRSKSHRRKIIVDCVSRPNSVVAQLNRHHPRNSTELWSMPENANKFPLMRMRSTRDGTPAYIIKS